MEEFRPLSNTEGFIKAKKTVPDLKNTDFHFAGILQKFTLSSARAACVANAVRRRDCS